MIFFFILQGWKEWDEILVVITSQQIDSIVLISFWWIWNLNNKKYMKGIITCETEMEEKNLECIRKQFSLFTNSNKILF